MLTVLKDEEQAMTECQGVRAKRGELWIPLRGPCPAPGVVENTKHKTGPSLSNQLLQKCSCSSCQNHKTTTTHLSGLLPATTFFRETMLGWRQACRQQSQVGDMCRVSTATPYKSTLRMDVPKPRRPWPKLHAKPPHLQHPQLPDGCHRNAISCAAEQLHMAAVTPTTWLTQGGHAGACPVQHLSAQHVGFLC